MTVTAEDVKACCAAVYASEAARWLLGGQLHPGGAALTAELGRSLSVGPDSTVVDVGCGPGASALQLAQETGCAVIGVDLSADNVAEAARAARLTGIANRARFVRGDAEALPLEDESADGVLSECAFCLVPDKHAAAAEVARVLRAGGRLALADVVADGAQLPPELDGLLGWAACVADARTLDQIAAVLEAAGLAVERLERRDAALASLVERVEARLHLARVLSDSVPRALREWVDRGLGLVAAARAAINGGALGYGTVIARRP
jgi:hypothetical protein